MNHIHRSSRKAWAIYLQVVSVSTTVLVMNQDGLGSKWWLVQKVQEKLHTNQGTEIQNTYRKKLSLHSIIKDIHIVSVLYSSAVVSMELLLYLLYSTPLWTQPILMHNKCCRTYYYWHYFQFGSQWPMYMFYVALQVRTMIKSEKMLKTYALWPYLKFLEETHSMYILMNGTWLTSINGSMLAPALLNECQSSSEWLRNHWLSVTSILWMSKYSAMFICRATTITWRLEIG